MAGCPVFVVGAPRTGTTLLREILNRHPRIHLFDEVHFFERIWDDRKNIGDLANPVVQRTAIQRIRSIVENFGSDKDVAVSLTLEEYRRRLALEGGGYRGLLAGLLKAGAELHGAEFWGDSSPQDVLYLSEILEWYPDARIVGVVRDPRGFLASYKNYHRRQVSSYRERFNLLTNSLLWRSYMNALIGTREAPWSSSVVRVRYEDLVGDAETEVRRLCDHIGVDFDPAMLAVERSNTSFVDAGGADAVGIFSTSRDRWRTELSRTEIWIGERIFGKTMRELGYEPCDLGFFVPSPLVVARVLVSLPVRLYNMLFRSHKPLRMSKVRRVLSRVRPR